MKKKILATLMAVMMIAALAACGGGNASSPALAPAPTPSSSAPDSSAPAPSQPESTPAASDVVMPTYPDAATVDLAAVDAQIKELAPKVKTITEGKLTMGTSADYAPYEFHILDNGTDKIVGFDIALGQAIAKELGVELEIKDISFDSILMEVNAGSVDVGIAGFTPTPARLEAIDMSHLYELQSQSLLVRKADLDKYTDVSSFGAGTNVGAQTGSIQEELALASTPDANHTSIQTIPSLVLDLQNQKVDAVVMETAVAEGYAKAQDDLAILCEVPYDSNGKGVVVKKGNEDLLNFVNAVVTKVVVNGDMAKFIEEANALSDQAIE